MRGEEGNLLAYSDGENLDKLPLGTGIIIVMGIRIPRLATDVPNRAKVRLSNVSQLLDQFRMALSDLQELAHLGTWLGCATFIP